MICRFCKQLISGNPADQNCLTTGLPHEPDAQSDAADEIDKIVRRIKERELGTCDDYVA